MAATALKDLISRLADRRVLVLGDMVADAYVVGRPARISREAPVLILEFADSFVRPGGATNAAYNLSSLGARTSVVGVIGDDQLGRQLRSSLADLAIDCTGLLVDPGRPTSAKTRILARGTQEAQQQVVRIDRVDSSPVDESLRQRMIEMVCRALQDVDALIVSDYENGVISQEVIEVCLPEARRRGLVVAVDAHGDLFRFRGVTVATPNQPEAEATLGRAVGTVDELEVAGREILERMDARGVLITRGSEGMALFEEGRDTYLLPVASRGGSEVVDPTGAGDTVAAVFTLAVASGADMRSAAYLANVAGGEVVRKLGAAPVSPEELFQAVATTLLPPPD
jgi:rfaE bifunctional protein kinase chain/domain